MDTIPKGTTQEDLNYIKENAGYALAKSLLWTIKTNTEDPLALLSAHLANVASFNAKKKKKKKVLIKKINSYNIKIRDEINKTFSQSKLADVYSLAKSSAEKDWSEDCVQLLQLIKQVFDVKNVYVGRTYLTGHTKKKKKKIMRFIQTTKNCDLQNYTIRDQQRLNRIYTKSGGHIKVDYSIYTNIFPFETGFLFPHFVQPDFFYDDPGDDLFTWVNPLHQGGNCARRVKNGMGPSAGENHLEEENADEEEEAEGDNSAEADDEEEDEAPEEETEEEQEHPLTDGHGESGHEHTADPSEEKKAPSCNEEEELQIELLNTLHMNLSYDCFYIYEVMREDNSFLYSMNKPGDLLLIPLVYYSYYNWHFLHELYCLRERVFLHSTAPCVNLETHGEADQVLGNPEEGQKEQKEEKEKNEEKKEEEETAQGRTSGKDAKPKLDWKKSEPVEMCLCLDNRGSVNKMSRRQINDLINFSYFLITRIVRGERKCVEEQVNYMISCEHGEEKEATDTLRSKMKSENHERIISEFKNTLTEHPLLNKSEDLTKCMCLLQWTKKEISTHQQRILQMSKIKVEWNQNLKAILLNCYILLSYDYSLFGASDDVEDTQWGQLILCVNAFLIDKLMSFDPLVSFEEKRTEELLQMDVLLDQVSSSRKKNVPLQMENITTFGLTLLDHFNKVTRDILKAIIKVKEEQLANAS
ncbi:conserved Plasmodium protein, unknown function [Plasmodium knowlesi strain H]|uniref:Uncharacterized protein n=3 Tax=Plasmodium knowlesi TaxID=5850 RepID=A0A5K1URW4_PLAKH|nr:conserved Plasmodium protein, unknown function [Plasmodium knowlesi strain H]OTN67150.1 Uncharacterized protein PKNOH_S07461600 [Plasmodium knowlesi]CAA9988740.1 conserved Plasmodium protein, unknown function [Plasmodium knowlesi strain H]SBO21690.1 conserved Plasmodium protein, unknown function [Plasmodium knowlesi strain H]SBO22063.1 conserved Plasmodium protein, unknown function [Plasmodium knowlesi strain H]VVS78214.1 conserved Plasmodium protein, unknown function [Plasmodium knowlesi s|eukprot:XP_002259716.1 hypothetical protein, conserved in Plasmodium species [Plasmodium knowlesi strain H]